METILLRNGRLQLSIKEGQVNRSELAWSRTEWNLLLPALAAGETVACARCSMEHVVHSESVLPRGAPAAKFNFHRALGARGTALSKAQFLSLQEREETWKKRVKKNEKEKGKRERKRKEKKERHLMRSLNRETISGLGCLAAFNACYSPA